MITFHIAVKSKLTLLASTNTFHRVPLIRIFIYKNFLYESVISLWYSGYTLYELPPKPNQSTIPFSDRP